MHCTLISDSIKLENIVVYRSLYLLTSPESAHDDPALFKLIVTLASSVVLLYCLYV